MKNTNKLLVVILALAIAVSSIAVTALTTSAASDTDIYELFLGSQCYVDGFSDEENEARRDYENGTYDLDYYEKDLYAPFDPEATWLEEGETYKAIYWLTIHNINAFYDENGTSGWEVKAMPTEEYYFNNTNADIWNGEESTSVAIVVPFKVTNINDVKLKLWTHGALIDGSCLNAIMVVGADYNAYMDGFDIVLEGVANVGANVENNKPADDEWTPSVATGINAMIYKPTLVAGDYKGDAESGLLVEDSYGAQCGYANMKQFDASIDNLIAKSFLQESVEVTDVVVGNQDNYVMNWYGTMTATESGTYTLIGRKIDNGFVMYVNGEKVYEYWGASHWFDGPEDRLVSEASFDVVAGETYDVDIYFLELGGGDGLEIWATTTPEDTNSGANMNDVFDFALTRETYWLSDAGHWRDYTNDTLVGVPEISGNGGQCENATLFEESIENLLWNFDDVDYKVVNSFVEPIEPYEGDVPYVIVYAGTLVPSQSGEYTFGANVIDNGFYMEILDGDTTKTVYEFWGGRTWNDDGSGNTYMESITLEAGQEYMFAAAFLETDGGQTLELVASVDGGERVAVEDLFTFSTQMYEIPDEPSIPEDTQPSNLVEVVTDMPIGPSGDVYLTTFDNVAAGVYKIAYYMTLDSVRDGAQMRVSPWVGGPSGSVYRCWIDWKTTDELNGHTGVKTFMDSYETNKVILVSVINVPEDGSFVDATFWQDENAYVGTLDKVVLAPAGYDFGADEEYTWVDEKGYQGNDPETTFGEDPGQMILAVEGDWTPSTRAEEPTPDTPITVYPPEFTTDVIAAGDEVTYEAYRVGGMILTIADADAYVIHNGFTYTAENGVVSVPLTGDFFNPSQFVIGNSGSADESYTVTFGYPVGSMSNPEVITEPGDFIASVAAGSMEGYNYTWTAPADGTAVVTITSAEGWMYSVSNVTAGIYGDYHWPDDNPVVSAETITVAAGDTLAIMINTYDPNDMWNTPAGDINWTLTFTVDGDEPTDEPSDEPTPTPTPDEPSDEPTPTPTPDEPTQTPGVDEVPTLDATENTVLGNIVEQITEMDGTAGIEIGSSVIDNVKDQLVIEMVIKPEEIAEHLTILSIGDASDKPYVVIGMRGDGAYKLNEFQGAAGAIKVGEWVTLKYVIGTDASQIYVNGELYAEGNGVDLANLEGAIKFGQATVAGFNDPAFKGSVAELRISTAEVADDGNDDGNGGSTTKPVTGDVAMIGTILAAGVAALGGLKLRKKSK